MATKNDFTPEEWKTLLDGAMMSGLAVTAAEPSGIIGMLKESFAASQSLIEGRRGPNELIRSIVEDFETSQGRTDARAALKERLGENVDAAKLKAKSIETLQEVASILEAKAPQDAPAVKEWLYHISQKVADAASEGGNFLGIGGVQVSDAEKATLAEISGALKLAA
ncbi:hypothetical protein T281_13180 [Rhodomicrobium udaipurense JA643]|uniref:Uncharacterized protein n=1 Tax=Rhodomicrobium udaipurense TaxID=1202716 RepID=A0A8I1GIE9_9HYPH|nr:hypothetical protein [Rhodomicrobium udaipurense]KAI94036.1 hypothetical protein T281_13180 [Rhodomicrobium udaipurense JA643]MBJ7545061.1 hypothetical protein [Rhodomicrobium udaipurense]